ncbi:MAG: M20 family metallopeptidase [Spirochaetia bacterium]
MITPARIHDTAAKLHASAVKVRRHLHRNPELSFEESETARFISGELESAGISHETDVGGHGIVAMIEGSGDRTVALRADIDALPIHELNEVEYRSQTPGVMHACGHDGHTASLLAAGMILRGLGSELPGSVKLIFQAAEERAPGGASAMIADGVLENPVVESVIGQHVNPELPVGTVGFKAGLFMGSVDDVYITVHGRGGHAAKPHQGIDPVAIASTLVVALQQIVSRNSDPIAPSVLSFGYINGAGATNVIPNSVELAGTFRTFDPLWRETAVKRIEQTARELVHSLGARAEIRIARGYPSLSNDPTLTDRTRLRAIQYLGEDNVVDLPPALWGEDFAYFAQARPSCFYNLGVRNESRGTTHFVHSPQFDLDEDALVVGTGLLVWIALGELGA